MVNLLYADFHFQRHEVTLKYIYTSPLSIDVYTFALPENAAVGTTVGRIMAEDGDIGSNAKMTYRLEDDLIESSTFIIETDPVTQEGVILLGMVRTVYVQFALHLQVDLKRILSNKNLSDFLPLIS